MPTASRVYSIERDRLLNEEPPRRWPEVKVEQNPYEPCLFKITRKRIGCVSIHVDPFSMHAGCPPEGDSLKWAVNRWFWNRPQVHTQSPPPSDILLAFSGGRRGQSRASTSEPSLRRSLLSQKGASTADAMVLARAGARGVAGP